MSWEAVAALAAVITVALVVAGIVFSGGRMVAGIGQLRDELRELRGELGQLREEVTGIRSDQQVHAQLSSSLQVALGAVESRVSHLERLIDELHRPGAPAKRPPARKGRTR